VGIKELDVRLQNKLNPARASSRVDSLASTLKVRMAFIGGQA
jgi:hypothetical protein